MMTLRKWVAFTLLELMVVIIIIAILAAIMFPVVIRSKRSAKGTVDISNMRQVYMAIVLYENDNNDRSPRIVTEVQTYAGSSGVFASPLDPRKVDRVLGDWSPAPMAPHGYRPRSMFKVSYAYLKTMLPDDEYTLDRFNRDIRKDPRIGILASPWIGEATAWDYDVVDGEELASSHGPRMKGPIQRIRMDGSYFFLKRRKMEDCLGGCTEDLFYFEN